MTAPNPAFACGGFFLNESRGLGVMDEENIRIGDDVDDLLADGGDILAFVVGWEQKQHLSLSPEIEQFLKDVEKNMDGGAGQTGPSA